MERKIGKSIAFLFILVLSSVLSFGLLETATAPTVSLADPPPADFAYEIPWYEIIPVQAAWNPDMNIDKDTIGDGVLDLVAGKPIAVIVSAPNDVGETLELRVTSGESTDYLYADVFDYGIAVFYLTLYNDEAGGETERGVTFRVNGVTDGDGLSVSVDQVEAVVRTTRDLRLFWGVMEEAKGKYTVPTESEFIAFVDKSAAFINKTYSVKNITSGKLLGGYIKKQSTMRKDCIKAGIEALENGYEVGVSVVNQDYFSNYRGIEDAVGVSFGPNNEGVIAAYNYPTVAAHEVAHTFWVYWGVPEAYLQYYPYGPWTSGVCPEDREWRTGYDFMGCAVEGTTELAWVKSEGTYNILFAKLHDPAVDPEIVIVSGIVSSSGDSIERPFPWSTVPNGTASYVTPGDYAIRFVDEDDNPLGDDVSFSVSYFMSINKGVAIGEGLGTVATDEASFVFAVAVPEQEYSAIQVIDNRDPLDPVVIDEVNKNEIVGPDYEPIDWGPWILLAIIVVIIVVSAIGIYLLYRK